MSAGGRAPGAAGGAGGPALQFSAIEPRPRGAFATVTLPNNGGAYEDVYAKTPAGWRFLNRSVYLPSELAARAAGKPILYPQDVLDIQSSWPVTATCSTTAARADKAMPISSPRTVSS